MAKPITSDLVVAYAQCPRKGFLLLCSDEQGTPHEYVTILEQQQKANQARYTAIISRDNDSSTSDEPADLRRGTAYVVGTTLQAQGLEADCPVLTRVPVRSSLGDFSYEPTIVTGMSSLGPEQKIRIAFAGLVLGRVQTTLPKRGRIVGLDEHVHTIHLGEHYKELRPLLDPLQRWSASPPAEPPPVILNKHCATCQFRTPCRDKAGRDDDLSLLDHMTPRLMQRYHRKGIFTVKQLSYLFRPRKSKKAPKGTTLSQRLELQALALRTGKIYLHEPPNLAKQHIELFLDIEGNPDQQAYYLIGLLIREGQSIAYHSFWADTQHDEKEIWDRFLAVVEAYPDAPIYHYGSYEVTAAERMTKRYQSDGEALKRRLVNISAHVYSKVYYPTHSNGLKEIGHFLGAVWAAPNASGLQSLVWRHRWEERHNPEDKQTLVLYNKEDCDALALLVDDLIRIGDAAAALPDVDFADTPKRAATEGGEQLHSQFEAMLLSAHATYATKKIDLSPRKEDDGGRTSRGAPKGHPGYYRAPPTRPGITHDVPPRETCPRCVGTPLRVTTVLTNRYLVDLVFTKNGCRKTITQWSGPRASCPTCRRSYCPPALDNNGRSALFGHSFQSWVIYLRLVLRLPYRVIVQALQDQFNESISQSTAINFFSYFFNYYAETEERTVQAVLHSPFIHVDETKISIEGIDQYVWVFTDGQHVFFRLTKTREAAIVHEILVGYTGVLISDFYGGYDAVGCRQQKCLVHLIRDLNEELWDHPFDHEFEEFVGAVGALIVPILTDTQRYGLKTRHLHKHRRRVDAFYADVIDHVEYRSEVAKTFQKRFERYRHSLFTFLEQDGIPWNNNMAERSIRHLAVQRKISGSFFASAAPHYLRLLGIMQTCRFQGKSLLKFLVSKEKDVDQFAPTKRSHTQQRYEPR